MPIGFIPRMASKVGTAVCGTACTVVCEVAWGTNPHAPTRLAKCCRLFLAVLLALVVVGTSLAVVVATLGLTLCAFLAVLTFSTFLAAVLLGSSLLSALVLTSCFLSALMLTSGSLSAFVLTSCFLSAFVLTSSFLSAFMLTSGSFSTLLALSGLLLAALFLIALYIALLCIHLGGEAHHSHHHDGTQNHFLHCLLVFE